MSAFFPPCLRVLPCVVLAGSFWLVLPAAAENWPQWRGPRLNGVSTETGLPTEFGPEKNKLWRVELPGPAGATPCVWEDRIYLTSVEETDLVALCVSTDGKLLWKKTVASGGEKRIRGDEGNFASPSPCTDGVHVWVCMGNGHLVCYTKDGAEVWRADLQERFGRYRIAFGMSATPVLDGDRLYLQLIHGEGNPRTREAVVVCLDKKSGETIWKQPRPSEARAECEHSYASPTIYQDGERRFLVTHGADYVIAHSLEDGTELWRAGELNPKERYNPTLRFVASPVASDGMIVVPSAKNGPVFAIKPTANGDITNDAQHFFWQREKNTPDVPSPLVHAGLVYLLRENGVLICMDAQTGEELYQERTVSDRHRASPVYADGKIYLCARQGVVSVVKAGPEFEILAKNELGEPISASPVISDGRLYIRTFDALWAFAAE